MFEKGLARVISGVGAAALCAGLALPAVATAGTGGPPRGDQLPKAGKQTSCPDHFFKSGTKKTGLNYEKAAFAIIDGKHPRAGLASCKNAYAVLRAGKTVELGAAEKYWGKRMTVDGVSYKFEWGVSFSGYITAWNGGGVEIQVFDV